MLFFKIEEELWPVIKAFVLFLDKLPEYPRCYIHDMEVDKFCLEELHKIYDGKEET